RKEGASITEIKHIYTHNINYGGVTNLVPYDDKIVATINNMVKRKKASKEESKKGRKQESNVKQRETMLFVELVSFTPRSWNKTCGCLARVNYISNYYLYVFSGDYAGVGDIISS
ncbi:hypothetical protein PFDG_05020, partial [Plasmodium falciparum Dd2]